MIALLDEAEAMSDNACNVPNFSETSMAGNIASLDTLRASQQRLDGIIATLQRARGKVRLGLSDAKFAYDDKWAEAVSTPAQNRFTQGDPAPRERYATYDLRAIEELRNLRKHERALVEFDSLLEVVQTLSRRCANTRRDLELHMRMAAAELTLER
jgi:hypothetical protein